MTRLFFLLLLLGSTIALAQADDPVLRPSARLLFKEPEVARPGSCVMYREGGNGWVFTEPVYWLKGTVVTADIHSRRIERCPEVPGKSIEQYSRDEFNRLAAASPCVTRDDLIHEEQSGLVRVRVEEWETPWARRAANANRLYQGHFLDRTLHKDMELEIEADLLGACS
ncbi:MAG TPA: hypothetical protein VJ576_15535 [Rhodocyclaceae bacterium]|nr:hypothetical protein [Rhodocyclaceae bacterium]